MIQFLNKVSSSDYEDVVDKYAPLRLAKINVYTQQEISVVAPIRAAYLKFCNEQSLKYLKQGEKKTNDRTLGPKRLEHGRAVRYIHRNGATGHRQIQIGS